MSTRIALPIVIVLAALATTPADADDVEDSVQEAMKAYHGGDYQGAASSLEYAAQLVRQKRGTALEAVLPAPLAGWTAGEAKAETAMAGLFGGLTSVERVYTKTDAKVTVRVVTDSPMLQGLMGIFSNPALAAASGLKMQRIAGEKAMVKYDPATKDGEVTVAIANRFMVTVEGDGVEEKDLVAFASAVDFKRLAGL